MKVNLTTQSDLGAISKILDDTGLFPSEILPDMIDGFFSGLEASGIWLTAKQEDAICGFCYAVPEKLTNGSWNMLAIAVSPDFQNQGIGSQIVSKLEEHLRTKGGRIMIVDTSGTEPFKKTRKFYENNHYKEIACIPDFWDDGDDKITFTKKLAV